MEVVNIVFEGFVGKWIENDRADRETLRREENVREFIGEWIVV